MTISPPTTAAMKASRSAMERLAQKAARRMERLVKSIDDLLPDPGGSGTGPHLDSGKSLAGDLDGQVRQIFKLINATLEKAGGKLSDMVQMTVFITDVRYGDRLTQIRREIFGDNFPGSALITVTGLAIPEAKVEIQGYAVIGSK
jgi:enamine deaminase RidA (YjgF/YER057c/UK114 family)